uniref:Putative secreted protein n=1 Tax=Ixodes ricinus TaxID=34613 RepID=A0A6B0UT89_IXORI
MGRLSSTPLRKARCSSCCFTMVVTSPPMADCADSSVSRLMTHSVSSRSDNSSWFQCSALLSSRFRKETVLMRRLFQRLFISSSFRRRWSASSFLVMDCRTWALRSLMVRCRSRWLSISRCSSRILSWKPQERWTSSRGP